MAEGGQARTDTAPAATYFQAAVALAIILFAGLFAEQQSRALAGLTRRATVAAQLETLSMRLQRAIESESATVERLAGALAVVPAPDADGFRALGATLVPGNGPARALAAGAADGAALVFPERSPAADALAAVLAENLEAASGLRLAATPDGPALVIWTAVPGSDAARAAAAVPAAAVFAAAGLTDDRLGLELALTGSGDAAQLPPYLGSAAVMTHNPVSVRVALPGTDWTLAAAPAGGWAVRPGVLWPIQILTLLSIGLIVGPMMRTRRLVGERQQNIRVLRDREAELAELSRRLGLALDASKVGVWDFNFDTGVLVWDDRMDELYGYPPTGRRHSYSDWRDRLHPEDLARAEAEFREAVEVTGRYVSDYRLLLPDGTVRHIRAIGAVYREAGGGSKIVGVNWDVTADVQRSEELNAKRLEAEAASIAKSQFLATMSHEIRTPMNGVIGMLDLILRTELDPAQRERAAIAHNSARHLLSILNDILDLSKLEANGITLDRAAADVHHLARDVVALMATGTGDRDIAVEARIAAEVPACLSCDAKRLRQVLMNLVGNAIKFTESGRVELCLGYGATGDGRLAVAVRDTGVGISEAAKRQLFQRFAQVNSSITRQRGGTGLGLAISRQLIELMGGEIEVESVPGLGSTFRFWIPAPTVAEAEAPDAAEAEIVPLPLPAAVPPARILVAEDNPTNRQIMAAYLAMAGHAAHMVSNGLEAVDAVRDGAFDLVIMDIQMPVMDGITAARRIRALAGPGAELPIIALTANAMSGDREDCLAAGMTEYVSKPVSLEALYAAIARSRDGYSRLRGRPATSRRRDRSCRWRRRRRACPRRGRPRRPRRSRRP